MEFFRSDILLFILQVMVWSFSIRLMLGLFRIRIGGQWAHCVILGTLIMTVSKFITLLGGLHLVAAFQAGVIFLYFCFVLKYSWFYALLIDVIGCIITLIMMTAANIAFAPPGQMSMDIDGDLVRFFIGTAVLCSANWLIAVTLERFRLGFSFIGKHSGSVRFRAAIKKPLLLFFAVIAAVLVFPPSSMHLMPYLLGVVSVCLFLLLRWSLDYEKKD